MTIKREWATPLTAGAFLLLATTGILMFFHVDAGVNKLAHEWLSWALLAGVALHVSANYRAFMNHLRGRKGRLLVGAFALLLAASFLPLGGQRQEPPFMASVHALAEAPLSTLAQVAGLPPQILVSRLADAGIVPSSDQESLADLVGTNGERQMHVLADLLAPAPAK